MWKRLAIPPADLRLDTTLRSGQAFSWSSPTPGCWTGVLAGRLVRLRQDPSVPDAPVFYHDPESPDPPLGPLLEDYFHAQVSSADLHTRWCAADPNFATRSPSLRGLRLLRQHPVECLFAFICSTNNNIPRISTMVKALATTYGDRLGEVEGHPIHAFPPVQRLAAPGVDATLRRLGFGYRAPYIHNTAKALLQSPPTGVEPADWLLSLRSLPYEEVRSTLIAFPGIGPKVADCVALMSLDKSEAIPVDTHVWQIAKRDYAFSSPLPSTRSITPRLYTAIGDHFRALFSPHSGWAHSVLFTADLNLEAKSKPAAPAKVKRRPSTPPPAKGGAKRRSVRVHTAHPNTPPST